MFQFSAIFSASMVSSAFDATISTDASNGRVSAMLASALESAYGLALPASPAKAIGFVNKFIGGDKAPAIASGLGGTAKAREVAQALHALGEALHAGKACKGLPALASMAAWCDPVALEAASVARKAAKAAAKSEGEGEAEGANVKLDTVPTSKAPTAAAVAAAWALVQAAAAAGMFTAAQCDAAVALFETCQRAPEKAAKAKAKAKAKATA